MHMHTRPLCTPVCAALPSHLLSETGILAQADLDPYVPASASPSVVIAGICHHAWLALFAFFLGMLGIEPRASHLLH